MARKPVVRNIDAELPPFVCSECWFYSPMEVEHGACYGTPPSVLLNQDGDLIYPRVIVMADDRGCATFKPRHSA